MALFNEIQVGRFNRALQKFTGIKGGAPVKQLGSEILPVFSIPWGVETLYLEGWSSFGLSSNVTNGVGNSRLRFFNPLSNNTIVVFTKLQVANPTASSLLVNLEGWIGTTNAVLPSVITAFVTPLDSRGNQGTGMTISTDNANAAGSFGNTPGTMAIVGGGTFDFVGDAVQELWLNPGQGMQLRAPVVNLGMNCTIWWKERFQEDSERT